MLQNCVLAQEIQLGLPDLFSCKRMGFGDETSGSQM